MTDARELVAKTLLDWLVVHQCSGSRAWLNGNDAKEMAAALSEAGLLRDPGGVRGPRGEIDRATENTVVQCDAFNAPDCTRAVVSEFTHQLDAAGYTIVPKPSGGVGRTDDLEQLKELAGAATPGPWEHWQDSEGVRGVVAEDTLCLFGYLREEDHGYIPYDDAETNVAFIAAANPQRVTDLCNTIIALQAEREGMREALEPFADLADILADVPLKGDAVTVELNASDLRRARTALASDGWRDMGEAPRDGWSCGKCGGPVAGRYSRCETCGHPQPPAGEAGQ